MNLGDGALLKAVFLAVYVVADHFKGQGTLNKNDFAICAVGDALGFNIKRLDGEPLLGVLWVVWVVWVRGASGGSDVSGVRKGGGGRGGGGRRGERVLSHSRIVSGAQSALPGAAWQKLSHF